MDAQETDGFNERLLKLMCLNQAVDKVQKELKTLVETRDQLMYILEEQCQSEKLANLLS